jgi:microcystin-dependent protein
MPTTPYLGEIDIVSFGFAPKGWAQCNGQFLPINQNQALFSLFGTTYGGNGQTTFQLPDFRGRLAAHINGAGGFTQGQRVGEQAHTIIMSEMPAHNHLVFANNTDGIAGVPGITPASNKSVAQGLVSLQGGGTTPAQLYGTGNPDRVMQAATIGNTGGSQPHENRQPYLTLCFITALIGIFPSRN